MNIGLCYGMMGLMILTGCADLQKAADSTKNAIGIAPSKPDVPTGTASSSPKSSQMPSRPGLPSTAAQSPQNVLVLGRESIVVSSAEFDSKCTQMVKPFTLSTNFGNLVELMSLAAVETANGALNHAVTGSTFSEDKAKHNMSLQLRAKIVQMNWLPMSMEVRYGEYLHNKMQGELIERDSKLGRRLYPVADRMLENIIGKVQEPQEYKFKVFVRARSEQNAMALPGGFVYIDKGLLDNEAKQSIGYFALSHEIAHVLQRHETRALQARIIDLYSLKGSYSGLLSTVRGENAEIGAAAGLLTTGKVLFEQHFSGQELQSDACAVRLLDRVFGDNGKLQKSLQSFIAILPPVEPTRPLPSPNTNEASRQALVNLVDMVSRPIDRHPDTAKRVANLKVMVEEIRKRQQAPKL